MAMYFNNSLMFVGASKGCKCLTAKEAEACAILFTMRKTKDLGHRRIIIASNVLEVVKAMNGVEDWSINFYVNDILFLMFSFEIIKFTFIG